MRYPYASERTEEIVMREAAAKAALAASVTLIPVPASTRRARRRERKATRKRYAARLMLEWYWPQVTARGPECAEMTIHALPRLPVGRLGRSVARRKAWGR